MTKKSLSEILAGKTGPQQLQDLWEQTISAPEYTLLPRGDYTAIIVAGELFNSKTNDTPGYRLTFEVLEGEYVGRRLFHDLWLTKPAMAMTKRDLEKLGVTSLDQLNKPLPPGIRCNLHVVVRKDDDGNERNRVIGFQVVGYDPPEPDPFAPEPFAPQPSPDGAVALAQSTAISDATPDGDHVVHGGAEG